MKTSILVIAHVPFASALKDVALHVFPAASEVMVYDVLPNDDPERVFNKIYSDLHQNTPLEQVLVFSDLIGATPANIGMRVTRELNEQGTVSEFFGGTNACMLLNAVRYADLSMIDLKAKVLEGGQKGMQSIDCGCHARVD